MRYRKLPIAADVKIPTKVPNAITAKDAEFSPSCLYCWIKIVCGMKPGNERDKTARFVKEKRDMYERTYERTETVDVDRYSTSSNWPLGGSMA